MTVNVPVAAVVGDPPDTPRVKVPTGYELPAATIVMNCTCTPVKFAVNSGDEFVPPPENATCTVWPGKYPVPGDVMVKLTTDPLAITGTNVTPLPVPPNTVYDGVLT